MKQNINKKLRERRKSVETKINCLEYLELNRVNFIENLEITSDIIFDRYTIEKEIRPKPNEDSLEYYETTLLAIRELERYVEESQKSDKKKVEDLKEELSSLDRIIR